MLVRSIDMNDQGRSEMGVEASFLVCLFERLESEGLSYAVLRNYQYLPFSTGGSDLDLAVLPEEAGAVAELITSVCDDFGARAIIDYTSSARVMRILGCHGGEWFGVAVDLFTSMQYVGVEYIASRHLLDRSVDYRGIRVVNDGDAAITALVKELLSNGKTRKDYYPEAVKAYRAGGAESLILLRESFRPEVLKEFEMFLTQHSDVESEVKNLVKRLRSDLVRRNRIINMPSRLINLWHRYRRLIQPAGFSVAVVGTDGSGKSTMIESVTPVLEQAVHDKIQYEHLRPNWLPALGVAMGKREGNEGMPVIDPHAKKPSGVLGSLARLAYYSIDYTLGYWIKIFPQLVRRPKICLFDRYYYDLLIDPKRMRISLPNWVVRLFLMFAPRPDVVLCLGGNPEILFERKPETSLDEVSRQVSKLQALCGEMSKASWIDTSVDLEVSRSEFLSAILEARAGSGRSSG